MLGRHLSAFRTNLTLKKLFQTLTGNHPPLKTGERYVYRWGFVWRVNPLPDLAVSTRGWSNCRTNSEVQVLYYDKSFIEQLKLQTPFSFPPK